MVSDSRGSHHKNSFDEVFSACVTNGLCCHKLEASTVWFRGGKTVYSVYQDNEITQKQFALMSDSTDYKE